MLIDKLRSLVFEISRYPDKSPQINILERFVRETTLDDVTWLDFVNFINTSSDESYDALFCVSKPIDFSSREEQALFREFYLSYPDIEWSTAEHPEVNCFYPGNLEPVAEQEALYTSVVRYTPVRASYSTPYHMPALYSSNSPFVDNGPQAHSAGEVPAGSLSFFNPIHQGVGFFCTARRWGKEVTVMPEASSKEEAYGDVNDAYYHIPQFWRMSLGQQGDIIAHQKRVEEAMQHSSDETSLLLYGVSRGAATTFTSLAHAHQHREATSSCFSKVAGVILEAPFNRVAGDLHSTMYFNSSVIPRLMDHNPEGISPANQVEHFPPDVPVLFITCKLDRTVPIASTTTLAKALASRDQNKVYLLTLEFSAHPSYPYAHPYDRHKYLTAVHAFRRECGLAYISSLADAGEKYLLGANILASMSEEKEKYGEECTSGCILS